VGSLQHSPYSVDDFSIPAPSRGAGGREGKKKEGRIKIRERKGNELNRPTFLNTPTPCVFDSFSA